MDRPLTVPEFQALAMLVRYGPASMEGVATYCGMRQANVMVKEGLLLRRGKLLDLTETGRALVTARRKA